MTFTKDAAPAGGQVALAATWEAKDGEADAVAEILRRMASEVKSEPGTLIFWPHRSSSNDRVFFLYELPHFDRKGSGALPDGQFHMIIASGVTNLGTKDAWTNFLRPLAGKLTRDGRIFMTLLSEPDEARNYYPQAVMNNLAKMGARISSSNFFVLFDHAAIARFGIEPPHHTAAAPERSGRLPKVTPFVVSAGRQ